MFPHAVDTEVASGWEERWREFHRPVRVGPLWIGPAWEAPPPNALAVVIEPAQAFGTGAHPTTRLCLELLVELRPVLGGEPSLLDVGCGSGVLAVAASLLGYRPVRALDVDPAAVEETRRNAVANHASVDVSLGDALVADLPLADVVVANIARDAVEALATRLRCRLLVASGYLDRDPVWLAGFRRLRRRGADGWVADLFAPDKLPARSRHSRV
jgi:ribosomal protein L11 methyltransferase